VKINKVLAVSFSAFCVPALSARIAHPEVNAIANLVRVHMVITDQGFTADNVWVPAK
jgi:hypothetical protein